jgi:hypothetical protein
MAAFVDLKFVDGLGLPYEPGMETEFKLDAMFDPAFNVAWAAIVAQFPGTTLQPLFDAMPAEELADIIDAIREEGEEPPDPFAWFSIPCDEGVADDLVAALLALPMVDHAAVRPIVVPVGAVSFATNPHSAVATHLAPAPFGMDARYAWDVAGGRGDSVHVDVIEGGWRLTHEDLAGAHIRVVSVVPTTDQEAIDHGTSVAGIIVASDNGVGAVGIAPGASLGVIRPKGAPPNLPAAINLAMRNLTRGDIILLPLGANIFGSKDDKGNFRGEVPIEVDLATQTAIRIATKRRIIVVEPAANGTNAGGVDIDTAWELWHVRAGSPTHSGALMVGAGSLRDDGNWERADFSTFGSRVDCFAPGEDVFAPDGTTDTAYATLNGVVPFAGTSAASAIITGVVASVQGMARANDDGRSLDPATIRRIFSTAALGTLPNNPLNAHIGAMPDLRKIARGRGWARILPVGASSLAGDSVLLVHLDADNRMVRREFGFFSGWSAPLPSVRAMNDTFALTAAQPAVAVVIDTDPIARLREDAFFAEAGGIHHMWWDRNPVPQDGNVTFPLPDTTAAAGKALAVALPATLRLLLAGVDGDAHLVGMSSSDLYTLGVSMSAPLVIDTARNYRRTPGPAMDSAGDGLAHLVAIDDNGELNWHVYTTMPPIGGSVWSSRLHHPDAVQLEPGARPAVLADGANVTAVAVGSDGWLRAIALDAGTYAMQAPITIDVEHTFDTQGPIALTRTTDKLVVLAVSTEGFVHASTRDRAGGEWSSMVALPSPILSETRLGAISPLGGVVAVSLVYGVMAIAVARDGTILWSLSKDGTDWPALQPLSYGAWPPIE